MGAGRPAEQQRPRTLPLRAVDPELQLRSSMRIHVAAAIAAFITSGSPAFADDDGAAGDPHRTGVDEVLFTTATGSIVSLSVPTRSRIHGMFGSVAATAGYFRGVLDGVPEDLGDLRLSLFARGTLELYEGGAVEELALSVGSIAGLSDEDPFDPMSTVDPWYQDDNHASLAARLGGGVLLGITYTIYTAPNGIQPTRHETTLAARVSGDSLLGRLGPGGKVAAEIDGAGEEGVYAEVGLEPNVSFDLLGRKLTVTAPVVVGGGTEGYYGLPPGDDLAGYVRAGVTGSIALPVPDAFGSWTGTAGVSALVREDALAELAAPVDDAGNAVIAGHVGFTIVH